MLTICVFGMNIVLYVGKKYLISLWNLKQVLFSKRFLKWIICQEIGGAICHLSGPYINLGRLLSDSLSFFIIVGLLFQWFALQLLSKYSFWKKWLNLPLESVIFVNIFQISSDILMKTGNVNTALRTHHFLHTYTAAPKCVTVRRSLEDNKANRATVVIWPSVKELDGSLYIKVSPKSYCASCSQHANAFSVVPWHLEAGFLFFLGQHYTEPLCRICSMSFHQKAKENPQCCAVTLQSVRKKSAARFF